MTTETHSSGTKERFEIPKQCGYCGASDDVQFHGLDGAQAKVKCHACDRVWRIEATPVWKIADRHDALLAAAPLLLEAAERAVGQLDHAPEDCDDCCSFREDNPIPCPRFDLVCQLRAAIAAARGN